MINKNFEAVPEAHAYLQQFVSPKELNHLVEFQPWFLAAHLEQYLAGYSTYVPYLVWTCQFCACV